MPALCRCSEVDLKHCPLHGDFDKAYWGEGGVDLSRWGRQLARGINYQQTGAPVIAGTPGQVRKISTGRKARGKASDDYDRENKNRP